MFLSYRRDDSAGSAGRIHEHLAQEFGSDAIFRDYDSLKPGQEFRSAIESALASSEVVVVVIGRNWLKATDNRGVRLEQPDDLVRREIEVALSTGKKVIPVLVDGAKMPAPEELPESIRRLAMRQSLDVRPGPDFQVDIKRLIAALEANTVALHTRRPPAASAAHVTAAMPLHFLIVSIFGVLALVAIAGGIYAIAVPSIAQTTLSILGAEFRTDHVGIAFVGIGFIIAFLTVKSVLKNQHDLAKLPND